MNVEVNHYVLPWYYVVCTNAERANNYRAFEAINHEVGSIMICKRPVPPPGFIRCPQKKHIESVRSEYPRLYEALKNKGTTHFPDNADQAPKDE